MLLTGYTLKGTLPAGLAFDPTTGMIRGRPVIPFTTKTDTITAYNAFGYSTTIINISYQKTSTIATLVDLRLSAGTLAPVFAGGTSNYTASELNSTASITVTPTATDAAAVLGGVTRAFNEDHADIMAGLDMLLDRVFSLAAERGLDVDLHVDETGDPRAASLSRVAEAVMRIAQRPRRGRSLLQPRGPGRSAGRTHVEALRRCRRRHRQPADGEHVFAGPQWSAHAALAR